MSHRKRRGSASLGYVDELNQLSLVAEKDAAAKARRETAKSKDKLMLEKAAAALGISELSTSPDWELNYTAVARRREYPKLKDMKNGRAEGDGTSLLPGTRSAHSGKRPKMERMRSGEAVDDILKIMTEGVPPPITPMPSENPFSFPLSRLSPLRDLNDAASKGNGTDGNNSSSDSGSKSSSGTSSDDEGRDDSKSKPDIRSEESKSDKMSDSRKDSHGKNDPKKEEKAPSERPASRDERDRSRRSSKSSPKKESESRSRRGSSSSKPSAKREEPLTRRESSRDRRDDRDEPRRHTSSTSDRERERDRRSPGRRSARSATTTTSTHSPSSGVARGSSRDNLARSERRGSDSRRGSSSTLRHSNSKSSLLDDKEKDKKRGREKESDKTKERTKESEKDSRNKDQSDGKPKTSSQRRDRSPRESDRAKRSKAISSNREPSSSSRKSQPAETKRRKRSPDSHEADDSSQRVDGRGKRNRKDSPKQGKPEVEEQKPTIKLSVERNAAGLRPGEESLSIGKLKEKYIKKGTALKHVADKLRDDKPEQAIVYLKSALNYMTAIHHILMQKRNDVNLMVNTCDLLKFLVRGVSDKGPVAALAYKCMSIIKAKLHELEFDKLLGRHKRLCEYFKNNDLNKKVAPTPTNGASQGNAASPGSGGSNGPSPVAGTVTPDICIPLMVVQLTQAYVKQTDRIITAQADLRSSTKLANGAFEEVEARVGKVSLLESSVMDVIIYCEEACVRIEADRKAELS